MSQCVPSWDNNQFIDNYNDHFHPLNIPSDCSAATKLILSRDYSNIVPNSAPEVPNKLDYEVAELTWENGHLALHGLGQPRIDTPTRLATTTSAASGTLESIVNQATRFLTPSAAMTMDALVPLCSNNKITNQVINNEDSNDVPGAGVGGFTHVESCSSGMNRLEVKSSVRRVPVVGKDWSSMCEYSDNSSSRQQETLDTFRERNKGTTLLTSNDSIWSADNTSSSGGILSTKAKGDDHRRSIMKDDGGSGETKKKGFSSVRSRAASSIHNQSERRRRDKINHRMKTLQKLVPNSNKIDKASMLDEVIEYLKQLKAQVTMINRMNINMSQMTMMPITLMNQQALHMSMMSTPMAAAAAMGMCGMLDMNNNASAAMASGRANMHVQVQPFMHPSAFMHVQHLSWDPAQAMLMPADPMAAFLACPSQAMDSYRMMASLYQQMQQTQQLTPNSKS